MPISQDDLNNWFEYHAPVETQAYRYTVLRAKAKELAELFVANSPPCADQTAAIRDLRKAVMAMNLTIACNSMVQTPPVYPDSGSKIPK